MQEQQEDNSTDDIYYLGNIIFTELNNPLSPKLDLLYLLNSISLILQMTLSLIQ